MNFTRFLFEKWNEPLKECIVSRGTCLTYQELRSGISVLAADLTGKIGSGNNCLLLSENSPFFILAYLAIIESGNTAVLVETRIGDDQLDAIMRECSIKTAYIQKKYTSKIPGCHEVITEETLPVQSGHLTQNAIESRDDDVAVVVYTSGSTGAKKGVMLTHRNLCANTESIVQYLSLTPNDRICVALPFFYCYGASLLHTHLRAGGSIMLSNNIFLGGIIRDINAFGCTGFAGVPSTFQILINKTPFLKEKFPTLRYMTQAGGQLPNKYIRLIAESFPEKEFFVMYGATEATARLSFLPPDQVLTRTGSIGKGIPGVTLEVLNEKGEPVEPGETGEITARGENIMKGYYGDPGETEKAIRSGRLFTGDLATIDEEGYIYVVGRAKNIIKSGGYRVSPNEIEEYINSIDGVLGCVVAGIPDDIMGEAIVAFIQPDNTSETVLRETILKHCTMNLPSYKVPKEIRFVREFPLNSSDKIDKAALVASLRNEKQ